MKMSAQCFAEVEANQVLGIFKEGIKNKAEGIGMPLKQQCALFWTAACDLTPQLIYKKEGCSTTGRGLEKSGIIMAME